MGAESKLFYIALTALCVLILLAPSPPPAPPQVKAVVATEQVGDDPDDPAIWVHPRNPAQSVILGTNKAQTPQGALVAFGLDGRIRQTIGGLDRPNNVDIEYGMKLAGATVDVAVLTERYRKRLRAFRISSEAGRLEEVSSANGLSVFAGEKDEAGAPMGIALYKRPRDGAIFAMVGRKTGPRVGYIWQYRLEDDAAGRVRAVKVREFGGFSGSGEIEAIAVDDALGFVYYADEGNGIHKWHADPDHPDASREVAHFGRDGFRGDREGIGIYTRRGGGYVICTDQAPANAAWHIFPRTGQPRLLKVILSGADETDGIEVTSAPLGPQFPNGLLVAMNSAGKNFLLFRWEDISKHLR